MAVPSRKNRMIQTIMQNQERDKEKLKPKTEDKKISEEEHKARLEKLKKMGLIKKG